MPEAAPCPTELEALLVTLTRPLPVYTHFRDTNGVMRLLRKACACVNHEGPHWLEYCRIWQGQNREMITANPASVTLTTLLGYAAEERDRLAERRRSMQAHRITRLLTAEDVLALQAGGESVAA